jgi:cell volume regulation protein A
MACVFILYYASEAMHANGITTILAFGLFLGNYGFLARALGFKEYFHIDYRLISFQAEVSFFVRTVFFVFIGLIINLSSLANQILLIGLSLFIALLAARYVASKILVRMNKSLEGEFETIFAMMPRGLTTAALAALPLSISLASLSSKFMDIIVVLILLTNIFFAGTVFYLEHKKKNEIGSAEGAGSGTKGVTEIKLSDDTEILA